jgi:stage II sporulation protein D
MTGMIAALMLALLLAHGHDAKREAPPEGPAPDSVTVLMFAAFAPRSVEITSATGLMVPEGKKSTRAMVSLTDGGLMVDGERRASSSFAARSAGVMKLRASERERSVRGIVHITTRDGRLVITARMARRDYLAGALAAEASPNDPIEYLTALSVLQNNYLLYHRGRHAPDADLCDNTHCQLSGAAGRSSRIYAAVDRASRIRLWSGEGLPCYYSVNCGGSTLTPAQVWNHQEPGYANVTCGYCRASERYRWRRTFEGSAEAARIISRAPATPFVDDDFKIGLGRVVGFNKVLSNTITRIERRGGVYMIEGRGFGHRIGLCQEGARQLALQGRSAGEILRYYFPSASLSNAKF